MHWTETLDQTALVESIKKHACARGFELNHIYIGIKHYIIY